MNEAKVMVYLKQEDKLIEFTLTNSIILSDMFEMHRDKAWNALKGKRKGTHAIFKLYIDGKASGGQPSEHHIFFDPPIVCTESESNFLEKAMGGFIYAAVAGVRQSV